MAKGDVDSWDITVTAFKKRYPAEIVATSPILAPSGDAAPDGSNLGTFLEAMLSYLASVQIAVLDHLADSGLQEAVDRMKDLRRAVKKRSLTSGSIESALLRGPNPLSEDDSVQSATSVAAVDVPAAALVASLWQRLPAAGKPEDVDFEAEVSLANAALKDSYLWNDLLRVLVEIRNGIHFDQEKKPYIERFPDSMWRAVHEAAVELGVAGPADTVLRRFTTGLRGPAKQREDGSFVCRFTTPSLEDVRGFFNPEKARDVTSDERILRFDDELSKSERGGERYRWVESLGPFRPWADVLWDQSDIPPIDYAARGQAGLSGGIVGVVSAGGRTRILTLPVDAVVVVTTQSRSAANYSGLQLNVVGQRTQQLTRDAIKRTIEALNGSQDGDTPFARVPDGMAGTVDVQGPEERCRVLGVDAATVLAACRAIVKTARGTLPDDMQVTVSRKVLDAAWYPYRDVFGWVDMDGTLVGGRLPCPRADLLMLLPTKMDRRPRRVDLTRVGQALSEVEAPTDFDSLAETCGRTSIAMEKEEANPLVSILRPVAREFAGGRKARDRDWVPPLIVSPFNWSAGILFRQGDPARDAALRWLGSRRLPRYVELYPVSTASTPLDWNDDDEL